MDCTLCCVLCVCVCVRVCVCVGCWMEAMSAYESMLNCNVGAEEDQGHRDGEKGRE